VGAGFPVMTVNTTYQPLLKANCLGQISTRNIVCVNSTSVPMSLFRPVTTELLVQRDHMNRPCVLHSPLDRPPPSVTQLEAARLELATLRAETKAADAAALKMRRRAQQACETSVAEFDGEMTERETEYQTALSAFNNLQAQIEVSCLTGTVVVL